MITVYFVHRTLTPENYRLRWDVEAALVPAIGDQVTARFDLPKRVTWTVAGREWSSAPVRPSGSVALSAPLSVTLTMVGPTE